MLFEFILPTLLCIKLGDVLSIIMMCFKIIIRDCLPFMIINFMFDKVLLSCFLMLFQFHWWDWLSLLTSWSMKSMIIVNNICCWEDIIGFWGSLELCSLYHYLRYLASGYSCGVFPSLDVHLRVIKVWFWGVFCHAPVTVSSHVRLCYSWSFDLLQNAFLIQRYWTL